MAKRKNDTGTATIKKSVVDMPPESPTPVVWGFPSRSRCPRCRSVDTGATHTDAKRGIQYRRCKRAVCRHRYAAHGEKLV